ncbi:hypothetical protein AWC38_SpisGene12674 [Stylophora pistillata]|uniref:Uncharacterized protein n=1 Tax=Stylophora pistillata TaxID=50429 RepID=A0A2B4RYU2_STYPI|nr:hypothetical protein AWC38_SpisGene12674 [Stylophora pistillata]
MAESNLPTTEEEVDLDNERPATAAQECEATSTYSKIDAQNDPLRVFKNPRWQEADHLESKESNAEQLKTNPVSSKVKAKDQWYNVDFGITACYTTMKILHVVLKKKNICYEKKPPTAYRFLCPSCKILITGRLLKDCGGMLVGQDRDVILEASTWTHI